MSSSSSPETSKKSNINEIKYKITPKEKNNLSPVIKHAIPPNPKKRLIIVTWLAVSLNFKSTKVT